MSLIGRFAAYAAAFEKAFESDDWRVVEPFFDEDAVYEVGFDALAAGPVVGRAAILEYFGTVLDALDRRFESRTLALVDGPREEGDTVRLRGTATYRSEGVPEYVLELEEIVTFRDDRIVRLEDVYTDATKASFSAYVDRYGAKLGLRLTG